MSWLLFKLICSVFEKNYSSSKFEKKSHIFYTPYILNMFIDVNKNKSYASKFAIQNYNSYQYCILN